MSGWKSRGDHFEQFPLWDAETDQRTIDVYRAQNGPERSRAVVVCLAGGGYQNRSWHEGPGTATWLAMHGVTTAVVPYRVKSEIAEHETLHPQPLRDACRAVRVVRDHAEQLDIDPSRVCVLGYSAGGHLAGSVATMHTTSFQGDTLAPEHTARPNAVAMIYPVVSLVPPCHEGSAKALLGATATTDDRESLSLQRRVSPNPAPLFLVHAQDDASVPLDGALRFAAKCRAAGGDVASHIFPKGGHGFGLGLDRPSVKHWPRLFLDWLRATLDA
ncbi:MAG: alpha/beta hydrolase [Planctomycetota bacterium]